MNPTKLYFGDDSESHLENALKPFAKNVMLTYGGGSIKKNGIYDTVMKSLAAAGKNVIELGVKSDMIEALADATIINQGGCRQLTCPEVVEIFQASL